MSDIKIVSPSTGTATFTISPPGGTSTDRTFNLPDETGTVLTNQSSVPLSKIDTPFVQLIADSGQTTSGTVMATKTVTFDENHSGHIDTHNFFNSSTNHIVPSIAGYYFITFICQVLSASRSGPGMSLPNSGFASDFRDDGNSHNSLPTPSITTICQFNGTDDYARFYTRTNSGSRTISSSQTRVSFFLLKAT